MTIDESKFAELVADTVADKVCEKISNGLLIVGVSAVVLGVSIITITNIIPSFSFVVYKKDLKGS
jgi:hypothetical protein